MVEKKTSCTIYDPQSRRWDSYLKLWGTRGSIPVSGPQYTTFGGNTCCLEVRKGNTIIIIDAGTGIRGLGDQLLHSDLREIHLFIGHTHWDHIIGFPFFAPLYNREFVIHIYSHAQKGHSIKNALHKVLKPDYFPVRLEEMQAEIVFHTIKGGEPVHIGELSITTAACDHPGGALAFKLCTPDRMIGYATDNEFLHGFRGAPNEIDDSDQLLLPYQHLIEFFTHCDPLIHEAQYTPREYRGKIGWGHSSMSNATALIQLCQIKNWIVTHHDPSADDATLRERLQVHWQILDDIRFHCHINLAFDGLTLPL